MKHGANVTKLITKFIAREAIPSGGGVASAVEFFKNAGREVIMKREKIEQMKAGREMDALVWLMLRDKPLNLLMCRYVDGDVQPHSDYPLGHISPPNYSTDANDMLSVSDNLRSRGFNARIEIQNEVRITIWKTNMTEYGPEPINTKGNSIPLAICRAALLAVVVEEA